MDVIADFFQLVLRFFGGIFYYLIAFSSFQPRHIHIFLKSL